MTMGKLTPEHTVRGMYGDVTTEMLVDAIGNKDYRKVEVAALYGVAIRYDFGIDWQKVNVAILDRWSKSALNDIKRLAWQAVENAGVQA